MATVDQISLDDLKKAFDAQSSNDINLYSDLEDAIGALNYINPSAHSNLMALRVNINPSAMEFGLPETSNLNRNIFQEIKTWICTNYNPIQVILNKIANDITAAENDADVQELLTLLKGIPVLSTIIDALEAITKIIVTIAHFLINHGLPALCHVPAPVPAPAATN